MRSSLKNSYFYLVTLPDRLYPFASKVEGKWVRGRRSYEHAVQRELRKRGLGRIGYKLVLYRETFHFIGSILFIIVATLISKDLFGSDKALYFLFGAAILALSYQEFYVHPKHYGQRPQKGIADWFSWVIPIAAYIYLFK